MSMGSVGMTVRSGSPARGARGRSGPSPEPPERAARAACESMRGPRRRQVARSMRHRAPRTIGNLDSVKGQDYRVGRTSPAGHYRRIHTSPRHRLVLEDSMSAPPTVPRLWTSSRRSTTVTEPICVAGPGTTSGLVTQPRTSSMRFFAEFSSAPTASIHD